MISRRLVLLGLVSALPACGFRLRGRSKPVAGFSELRLDDASLSAAQSLGLRRRLQSAGVRLSTEAGGLSLLRVRLESAPERRILGSVGSSRSILRLTGILVFTLIGADGAVIIDDRQLRQSLDLELDEANLLEFADEKQRGLRNLEESLFNSLMIQLSRL